MRVPSDAQCAFSLVARSKSSASMSVSWPSSLEIAGMQLSLNCHRNPVCPFRGIVRAVLISGQVVEMYRTKAQHSLHVFILMPV